jgi:signal transduction histidine kinase
MTDGGGRGRHEGGPDADDAAVLLAAAAHEIKNALGPLAMTLQLAERQLLAGRAVAHADLAFARGQVQRISRLVLDLMDVAGMDLGHFAVEPITADLRQVVSGAVEAFRRGQSLELPLTSTLPDDPVLAPIDAVRIEQVLLNLLENASRYAPAKAPISVDLCRHGESARVSVHDRGPGVPAAEAGRLFDRFVRGAAATGTGGLGLGLYLCRQIVEAHGGTIGVDSSPGQGATFWFELPCR